MKGTWTTMEEKKINDENYQEVLKEMLASHAEPEKSLPADVLCLVKIYGRWQVVMQDTDQEKVERFAARLYDDTCVTPHVEDIRTIGIDETTSRET